LTFRGQAAVAEALPTARRWSPMFELDLQGLKQESREWTESIPRPGEIWPDLPAEFQGAAELHARAELSSDGSVHVQGRIRAEIRQSCRRCLTEIDARLDVPLNLWFRPGVVAGEEEGIWALAPEAGLVDLGPAILEELTFATPAFPACSPDCRGLCPICGARRDEVDCACATEESDPRWNALRSLLD
jgi:uncharacterized protein